jgi:D-amino peptidase
MRFSVLAACTAVMVTAFTPAAQVSPTQPGMRVFISADMEGIAGVVQPAQLGPAGFEYGRAREWMTREVVAAMAGATDAGATGFVVADSHGNAQNLLIEQLPDTAPVQIVRGFPRPLSMMQGVEGGFAAAIFIGYHASEMTPTSVRGHTFSSARLLGVTLNGTEVSEGMFNAALAGHFNVPVVFVSGDRKAVEQMQAAVPGIGSAIVKEPFGYHSAMTVTPQRAQAMIRNGVKASLEQRSKISPYRLKTPVEFEIGFKLTIDAERAALVPGLERAGAHAIKGSLPDITKLAGLVQVLTSLEIPE